MHENFPAGGIITGGLGMDACKGLAITTQFNLWCLGVYVSPGAGHFGGGSKPLAPGEIHTFFRPVPIEQQPYFLKPVDYDPFIKTQHVVVRVTLGGKEFERDYVVADKRAKTIIKVINVMNVTRERINVVAQNLTKIVTNATAVIKNLRKKK